MRREVGREAGREAGRGAKREERSGTQSCSHAQFGTERRRTALPRVRQFLLGTLIAAAWPMVAAQTAGGQAQAGERAVQWSGWLQGDFARVLPEPAHTANARLMGEITGKGKWSGDLKWKLSARAAHDFAYGESDFYLPGVRRDQRSELAVREAYVDMARGDWEWRLGSQHIVWGEMVGLFFADVVSAKDLRQFVLPEFEQIRIPQWAARAEYFKNDRHLEFVWLPAPAYDRIGKPGADFYPLPYRYDGLDYDVRSEQKRARTFGNGGFGARFSTETGGWDWSAFVYRSPDSSAAFEREVVGLPGFGAPSALPGAAPTVIYRPTYGMLNRVGGTVARDFDGVVLKAEAVVTEGRRFSAYDLAVPGGLIRQNTIDWVVGLEGTPGEGWRLNGQLYQRLFLNHDPVIGLRRYETGASLMVTRTLTPTLEAELLGISSLVRNDWLARASLNWKAAPNVRVKGGVDAFGGDPLGLFGRYGKQDRVYGVVRVSY